MISAVDSYSEGRMHSVPTYIKFRLLGLRSEFHVGRNAIRSVNRQGVLVNLVGLYLNGVYLKGGRL